MHFFQHFRKFSVHLIIPSLSIDQERRFGQEATTGRHNRIVLTVTSVQQNLENTVLIGDIERNNREDRGLAAHLMNFMGELAKILLNFLREWEQVDGVLKSVGT